MKIYSLKIKIENGLIIPKSDKHAEYIRTFFSQWNGQEVRLEVSELKSKRSEEQNRYYFFYLSLIEDETGNKKEDLHNYFKGKFLTSGITEIYGDKVRITKSTTELSKGEFCNYLVEISQLTGVELPNTEEHFGYSYHK